MYFSATFNDPKLAPLPHSKKVEKSFIKKKSHFLDATDESEISEELGQNFVKHYLERLGYENEKTSDKFFDDNCFLFE